MSALGWWTVGLGAGGFLCAVYAWWASNWAWEDPFLSPIAAVVCAVGIALIWLAHFSTSDQPAPAPTRQCVTQQLENVWQGKFYRQEWVCTGWAQ